MKFVLATLALATTADAHWPFGHHHGHHKHHEHAVKPLEEFHCDYDKSGDMEHMEFLLKMKKTVWKNLVKGIYQDNITNPID